MKKFLVSLLIITLLSTLYVSQYTKLLECSYRINTNTKSLSLLIDQNKALRYNIAKLEAPARLEGVMLAKAQTKKTDIYLASSKIRIEKPVSYKEIAPAGRFINTGKVIFSMFSFAGEAIAKELNE